MKTEISETRKARVQNCAISANIPNICFEKIKQKKTTCVDENYVLSNIILLE